MAAEGKRRLRRRAQRATVLLGLALTLVVVLCELAGGFGAIESWLYDQRIRHCQHFFPQPTDQLMMVGIDDQAVKVVGRWPWDRAELAMVIDELRLAGTKVIGLDLLFPEPSRPRIVQEVGGTYRTIDDDAILAEAIARHGNVVIATAPTLGKNSGIIERLGLAARDVASVVYGSADAVSRSVPLLNEAPDGRVVPHFSLVLAARFLDTDPSAIRETEGAVVLSDKAIPTTSVRSAKTGELDERLRAHAYIPWFGNAGAYAWRTMFDWPNHSSEKVGYSPILRAWDVGNKARTIARQDRPAENRLLVDVLSKLNPHRMEEIPAIDAPAEIRRAFILKVIKEDINEILGSFNHLEDLSEEERGLRDDLMKIANTLRELIEKEKVLVDEDRRKMAETFAGKTVVVGWTGTAALDEVPTPLHPKSPGIVVHAALFNGILTGAFWRPAPGWVTILMILGLGLTMTRITVSFGPLISTASAVILGLGYMILNGYLLFDYANLVVGMGGPVVAIGFVWAGCTVFRFVLERLERARVERRFRSYVDPVLVDYVLAHPEKTQLSGELREMTVVFTDLAGFTTLSERLQEKTVPLLSEYLEHMVPLVREHGGTVDKFLGDGMMFFYGAPVESDGHAVAAVATLLRMQKTLVQFNQVLAGRGLAPLAMRAGVGAGPMVVGDAGPSDACDYTVLGDTVNLAARLESANKATGTWILINQRARELIGDRFLVRPVGNIQVAGKTGGVRVHEPLCNADEATDQKKQMVQMVGDMVDAFMGGQFGECLQHAEKLEQVGDSATLCGLYRQQCRLRIENPPVEGFDGLIKLAEK